MRATAQLAERMERNLFAYVTAAGAAGMGMLSMVQPAEAKVVYTPTHVVISLKKGYPLDLNNDGNTDLVFSEAAGCDESDCYRFLLVVPRAGSFIRFGRFAAALARGDEIGPTQHFSDFQGTMASAVFTFGGGTFPYGPWANVKNRYLGLNVKIGGDTHYGWARLNVKIQNGITATLTGYAYETVPDKPIIAGNRGGPSGTSSDVSPEPVSLGHLALGATGRKQNRQSQIADH